MLRKLRRSIAHDNLRRMEVKQVNKKHRYKDGSIDSKFSKVWKQYDRWIPVAPKRSAKPMGWHRIIMRGVNKWKQR